MPALLLSPLVRIAVYALLVLAAAGFCFVKGMHYAQTLQAASERDQAVAVVTLVKKQIVNTDRVVGKYRTVKCDSEVVFRTVEKEIAAHDSQLAPCPVPLWFVRVRNDAISLRPSPSPALGTDDACTALTLTDLARHDLAVIETATHNAQQLNALIEWVATSYAIQKEGTER